MPYRRILVLLLMLGLAGPNWISSPLYAGGQLIQSPAARALSAYDNDVGYFYGAINATNIIGTPAVYWNGMWGSDMNTIDNWNGGIAPTARDVAIFDKVLYPGGSNPNGGTNRAHLSILRGSITIYGGTFNGDVVTYDDSSLGGGTVNGNVVMHNTSFNAGATIKGTTTFLDSSYDGPGGPYKSLRFVNGKWLWPNAELFLDLSNRVVSGVSGVFSNLTATAQNGISGTTGTVGSAVSLTTGSGGSSTLVRGASGSGITFTTGMGATGFVSADGQSGGAGGGISSTTGVGGAGIVSNTSPIIGNAAGGNYTITLGAGGTISNKVTNIVDSSTTTMGSSGGGFTINTGAGGVGYSNGRTVIRGGTGGSILLNATGGGLGGNVLGTSTTTNIGGIGGSITLQGATGGSSMGNAAYALGGSGGSITITAGTGASAQSYSGTVARGGSSGTATLRSNVGGTANGIGTNYGGASGNVAIGSLSGGAASGGLVSIGGVAGNCTIGAGRGGVGSGAGITSNGADGNIIFQFSPFDSPTELARMTTNTFTIGLKVILTNNLAWDDALGPAALFNSGATEVSYNDTLGGLQFTTSAVTNVANDHATFNYQLSHRYKLGTDLHPHIHFWQTNADQTNMWYATYSGPNQLGATNMLDIFVGPATNVLPYTGGTMMQLADLPDISGAANTNVSSNIRIKLYRRGSFGTGNVTATDLDMHYQVDGFGSDLEYTKTY